MANKLGQSMVGHTPTGGGVKKPVKTPAGFKGRKVKK